MGVMANANWAKYGGFRPTLLAFFLAEMGNKQQIATVTLAVQYNNFMWLFMHHFWHDA
jgi:putative Ca2+/H+ antiporter (TMEM165/GDT1 family)